MNYEIRTANAIFGKRKFTGIKGVIAMPLVGRENVSVESISFNLGGTLIITVYNLQSYRQDPKTNWVYLSSQLAAVLYEENGGWQPFTSTSGRFKANLSNKLNPFKP